MTTVKSPRRSLVGSIRRQLGRRRQAHRCSPLLLNWLGHCPLPLLGPPGKPRPMLMLHAQLSPTLFILMPLGTPFLSLSLAQPFRFPCSPLSGLA